MSSPHVGIWLVALGFITKRQLTLAMDLHQQHEVLLDEVLIQQRYLTQEELDGAMQLQADLAGVTALTDLTVGSDVLGLIPRSLAMREHVLPLRRIGERLIIAHVQGVNRQDINQRLFDQVAQISGLMVHGLGFHADNVEKALRAFYEATSTEGLVSRAVLKTAAGRQVARSAIEVDGQTEATDAPIIELVNKILVQAVEKGASDLHLRPTHKGLLVKLRLDGVLQPLMELPKEVEAAVISRLKIMADLNIAERRRPQDGRCSIMLQGKPYDLRVACISSHWGEMMVMRILRPLVGPQGFSGLGFREDELARWQRIITAPNGLILVTGPTGSGKTSTLYATLNSFDRSEKNLLTVEDPVEYPVSGVGQIQVSPTVGLTFAAALRSILRLDPDVILIGEIRDKETLEIALEAALTGHIVLSTLHTNDAVSAISRMVEMGAPRHQVAATLVGVMAQRLVRRICPHCVRDVVPTQEDISFLGLPPDGSGATLRVGAGCDLCDGIGYKGRLGVYEVLEMTGDMADMITHEASTLEMTRVARKLGMKSLLEDGKAKVRQGLTTCAEVQRVIGFREKGEADAH